MFIFQIFIKPYFQLYADSCLCFFPLFMVNMVIHSVWPWYLSAFVEFTLNMIDPLYLSLTHTKHAADLSVLITKQGNIYDMSSTVLVHSCNLLNYQDSSVQLCLYLFMISQSIWRKVWRNSDLKVLDTKVFVYVNIVDHMCFSLQVIFTAAEH